MLREACVGTLQDALRAQELGCDRIELCRDLEVGGLTPTRDTILEALWVLSKPVMVIVRLRPGDFVYSEEEKRYMLEEIDWLMDQPGLYGVVTGALTAEGAVDAAYMGEVMRRAKGKSVTFHMAFDACSNVFEGLETLINLGVDRILTRGRSESAATIEGRTLLKALVEKSRGRIVIMPGGGVTLANYQGLAHEIGTQEVHGTRIY